MTDFTYYYSQLSAQSVLSLMKKYYGLSDDYRCKYYTLGLHDNYLLSNDKLKYILRIYRNDWRTLEDIQFELHLLHYLKDCNCPVAHPISNNDNSLYITISSPEGDRHAALFKYAPGSAPQQGISAEQSELLGKTVANIHIQLDRYHSPFSRQPLDLPYLLDHSVAAILPYLQNPEKTLLQQIQQQIHARMPALETTKPFYGICVGDINAGNFHIDEQKNLCLFDFDQCGIAHRAFEIAKFNASLISNTQRDTITAAFLSGYQQHRALSEAELAALPCYQQVALIWVMAIHVYNVNRIGHQYLEQPFWRGRLDRLQSL